MCFEFHDMYSDLSDLAFTGFVSDVIGSLSNLRHLCDRKKTFFFPFDFFL
jgi:hypothetical protein